MQIILPQREKTQSLERNLLNPKMRRGDQQQNAGAQ